MSKIIYSWQNLGGKNNPNSGMVHYAEECFALCLGEKSWNQSAEAVTVTGDTAIWGFREIRKRRAYFLNKKRLLDRIFRTVNLTLWQKKKTAGDPDSFACNLAVIIIGDRNFWVGNAGGIDTYLDREGLIEKVTNEKNRSEILGKFRYGITPEIQGDVYLPGDTIISWPDKFDEYIEEEKLREIISQIAGTKSGIDDAVRSLLAEFESNGAPGDGFIFLAKHL